MCRHLASPVSAASSSRSVVSGVDMHEKQKIIGYMIAAIVAYYILSAIVPFLIVALIGWIMACVINQNKRGRWKVCHYLQRALSSIVLLSSWRWSYPSPRFSPRKLISVNVKTLGDQLHLARIKANLPQSQVAQKLRVSTRTVRKWECGKACSNEDHWQAMAQIFRLDY